VKIKTKSNYLSEGEKSQVNCECIHISILNYMRVDNFNRSRQVKDEEQTFE